MNEGIDAAIFYVSVAALAGGAIRVVRAAVERRSRDRAGLVVAACGGAGLIVAVVAFLTGPRGVLPF